MIEQAKRRIPVAAKLGRRFQKALKMAFYLHQLDVRKGTDIPYVSHLLAVASLVLEDGGDEDEAISALLHDAVEDHGGLPRLELIQTEFGNRVADIVKACSDSDTEDPSRKPPWRDRKEAYLLRLSQETSPGVLRVSAADKLHNARCILVDYRRCGDSLWNRFNAPKAAQAWYYLGLARIFSERGLSDFLGGEFTKAAEEIARIAGYDAAARIH
jgi:(p)ppGpp synthase/HD superfamily hydrolase